MDPIISPTAVNVEKAILDHPAFNEVFEIHALDKGGIINLQGSVPSKKHLKLAETIAKSIKGVSKVMNEMEIDPSLKESADFLDIEDETLIPPTRLRPHDHR